MTQFLSGGSFGVAIAAAILGHTDALLLCLSLALCTALIVHKLPRQPA